jgi:hypothetical protein
MASSHSRRWSQIGKGRDFTETFWAAQQTSGQQSHSYHQGGGNLSLLWNLRSTMRGAADLRGLTRPKLFIAVKKVMTWVCFIPLGSVDIVMFPPGETSDRAVFLYVILDRFKTKSPKFPVPIQKRAIFLPLDNRGLLLTFWDLKGMLEGSSFETVENLHKTWRTFWC